MLAFIFVVRNFLGLVTEALCLVEVVDFIGCVVAPDIVCLVLIGLDCVGSVGCPDLLVVVLWSPDLIICWRSSGFMGELFSILVVSMGATRLMLFK